MPQMPEDPAASIGIQCYDNFHIMTHLHDETSPYLLQHADNPVDWYPWGDAALERAHEEK